MTMPEFGAVLDGFAAFHGAGDDDDAPSADAFRQALADEALEKAARGR